MSPLLLGFVHAFFLSTLLLSAHAFRDTNVVKYHFKVAYMNITQLGVTRQIAAVNHQFPGPTIYANEGQRVLVTVTNHIRDNLTIHWHGIHQLLSGWSDGPVYITQCPIQTGQKFVYNFTVTGQTGTYFYHAHSRWLAGTVHGAIVIRPSLSPYAAIACEKIVLLGELYSENIDAVEMDLLIDQISDKPSALSINGRPGPLYNGSRISDTETILIHQGERFLIRVVNAALNYGAFFGVANHSVEVVEVDGSYVKSFVTDIVHLGPGQTLNVILTANQSAGQYYMAASTFLFTIPSVLPYASAPAAAVIQYLETPVVGLNPPALPLFPDRQDERFTVDFQDKLKGFGPRVLNDLGVMSVVDKSLHVIAGFGFNKCHQGRHCVLNNPGVGLSELVTYFNNVSYVDTDIALLQAHYFNIPGVFQLDFPQNPPPTLNITSEVGTQVLQASKVIEIAYDGLVQMTIQNGFGLGVEGHPFHLHGHSFYVLGQGFGLFNEATAKLNMFDPPLRHTIQVPGRGWTVIRFRANNPGMWILHCHISRHFSTGMTLPILVQNGHWPSATLPPPPDDLPKC